MADVCSSCSESGSCGKTISGYRKFDFNERPFGELFKTEDAAWDTGDKPYTGSFEVYPICR